MRLLLAMLLPLFLLLSGCVIPPQAPLAAIPARQVETQKVTLGNVQMVVKKGASNADVIGALSSPNIVTTNKPYAYFNQANVSISLSLGTSAVKTFSSLASTPG